MVFAALDGRSQGQPVYPVFPVMLAECFSWLGSLDAVLLTAAALAAAATYQRYVGGGPVQIAEVGGGREAEGPRMYDVNTDIFGAAVDVPAPESEDSAEEMPWTCEGFYVDDNGHWILIGHYDESESDGAEGGGDDGHGAYVSGS